MCEIANAWNWLIKHKKGLFEGTTLHPTPESVSKDVVFFFISLT